MDNLVAVANFRTSTEAEIAAGLLAQAAIPHLVQSAEGMKHGPLSGGASILVRPGDERTARDTLGAFAGPTDAPDDS